MGMCNSEYVRLSGHECPYCRYPYGCSEGTLEYIEEATISIVVTCNHCHRIRRNLYDLSGYEDLDEDGNWKSEQEHTDDPTAEDILSEL